MTKPKFKKFVVGMDSHIGWEITKSKGRPTGKVVTHDSHVLRLHLDFIKDFKPDYYVAGGDVFNMSPISRHNNGVPRLVEGLRLQDEYELADDIYFAPLDKLLKKSTKVYLPGNHEAWIEYFIDKNPTIAGLLEPENVLQLSDRGWQIEDYGAIYRLGKLHIVHGDAVRSAAKHRAATMLGRYKKNILSGHVHTAQMYLETAIADEQPHMSVVSPMLGAMKPAYLNGAPTNWAQGWTYGYLHSTGDFNIYTVIVSNGRCIIEGKLYE